MTGKCVCNFGVILIFSQKEKKKNRFRNTECEKKSGKSEKCGKSEKLEVIKADK